MRASLSELSRGVSKEHLDLPSQTPVPLAPRDPLKAMAGSIGQVWQLSSARSAPASPPRWTAAWLDQKAPVTPAAFEGWAAGGLLSIDEARQQLARLSEGDGQDNDGDRQTGRHYDYPSRGQAAPNEQPWRSIRHQGALCFELGQIGNGESHEHAAHS